MATLHGDTLPTLLQARLGADRGAMEGVAVPVCTVDADGYPHPAMMGYAELAAAADDPSRLRAAVWGQSSTARHLRQNGRITLLFVDDAATFYVKAQADGPEHPHPHAAGVAVFPLRITAVLGDAVDTSREPEAAITSGIRFRRTSPGTSL